MYAYLGMFGAAVFSLLIIPTGTTREGFDCPNIWWQLHECGPANCYHVHLW